MADLNAAIARRLERLKGSTLEQVVYCPLVSETDVDEMKRIPAFTGGEVVLHIGLPNPLYIAWDENAGWRDHFSLSIGGATNFSEGALWSFDASEFPLWAGHIGRVVDDWRIWGFNETPHAIELIFASGSAFIGDGYRTAFGDGDDTIVSDRLEPSAASAWQQLASSVILK